ncbi:MAG: VOC family protein [Oscillospiraceae bacterium]|nr:VOC family protein [Oscillospiraceae bacterium]
MSYKLAHVNLNVTDLNASIKFYEDALGLKLAFRFPGPDFEIAFLGDDATGFQVELTYLKSHPQKYDLSDNEIHLAVTTPDIAASLEKHKAMGIVSMVNEAMGGLYFIEDPDGYWTEIVPER